MTTLPKITTPQPTAISMTSLPAAYNVYPACLPTAMDIPQRINPLQPGRPDRRTHMLETKDPHWLNAQRSTRMKQREHYRYHNAWSKYYYGSVSEQEQYRAYTRSVLKQQMTDKWDTERQAMKDKVRETEVTMDRDISTRIEDAVNFQRKYDHLKTFRDANKMLMENTWDHHRRRKWDDDMYDREQLKFNPINWSGSLK